MKKLFLALLILVCLQQVSAYTYGNNFTATVLSTTEGLTNTTVQWATCFKATDSTNITKVNLFVTKVSTTNQCSNVTLQGGNALGQPNGTVLSTGGFCIASGTGWVTANMQGTGYRVGAGTTYCAVVKANGTGTTSTTNYVRLGIWTTPYQNFTALNLYANSSWNRFYFDTSWKQQNQSPVVVFTYNDSRTQLGNGYDSASLQLIYGSRWIAENFTLNTSQQLWNFTARISKNTSTTPPDNLRMQINWANGSVVVANFTFLSNATVTTTATAYTAAMPNNPVLPAGRYQAVLLSPARSAIGGAAYQWSGFTGNTFSNATWNGTTSFMQSTTDNGSNWVSSTSTDMFFFFNSTDFEFIAPNVTQLIPAPQANRTTAAVNLSCRASDNNNLTKIELFGNFTGAWAINATNSTPINNSITNFNLTGIADGVYLWNCRATDAQGLATFNSTNATFIVDSIPPSPVLTTPSNNTIIGGLVSLQANSPDNLVGTKNVTYQYQNSTRSWTTIGTSTAGTPWSITLNTTALTDGLYQIRIQSWDNFGNLNTTTNYTITIDNGLPSVFNVQVIYRCAYDSTDGLCDDSGTETFLDFTPPNRGNPLSNVTIRVNASDNTGIRNVTLNGSAYGLGIFNMTRISGNSQTTTTAGCYDGMSLSCDYAQSCTGSPMSDCENNGNTCSQVLCPITVTANALYEVNLTTPVVADGFYNFRITAIDISTPANKNNATNPQVEVWNQSARWNNVKQYTCTSADNTVTPPVCLVRVEVPIGNTVTTADNVSFSVDWTQSRTGLCLNMSIASWNLTTTFVNDTPVAFDDNWEFSPSCTTFKRVYADKVSLTVADRNISFKMYGNSSILGNLNVTDTYVFTVVGRTPSIAINPDTSLPIIFDNWSDCYVAQTCRQVRAGDGVLFSAKWFADQAMNYSIFSRANGTGFINDTLSTVPASNWSNFTTNPLSMGAVFTWQIWVNDSRGRMGVSAQQTLTPIPSNIQFPILSTNQTFLGSQVNFSWTYLSNYNITSYIFSFNNGSGVFVNDSTVNVGNAQRVEDDMFPFGITFNESNYVIKGINNTFNSTVQWTVYLFDQYGGVFNSSIQSFQTNYPFPLVTAINNPPSNHSNLSTNNFTFNFTVFIGNDINNISIFSNSSGTWGRNATNSTPLNESELQLVTVNNLPQAKRFIWNVQACDTSGSCGFYSANQTSIVDFWSPNVTSVVPVDNFNSSFQTILFNATVTDNVYLQNVSIYTNVTGTWKVNATNSSLINYDNDCDNGGGNECAPFNNSLIQVAMQNVPKNTRFIWNYEACDAAGNCQQQTSNRTMIVDLTAPNVSKITFPTDGLNISNTTFTVNATASDNIQLSNVSVLANYSGTWQIVGTNSSPANGTPTLITLTNVPQATNFNLTVQACDFGVEDDGMGTEVLRCRVYNSEFWLIVDITPPQIPTIYNLPNGFTLVTQQVNFSAKVTDNVHIRNASIFHNATGTWVRNATNSTLTNNDPDCIMSNNCDYNNTALNVTVNNLPLSTAFTWAFEFCDDAGNCNMTNNISVSGGDLVAPNVTAVNFPANHYNSSSQSIVFNITATDNTDLKNASIFLNSTGTWLRNTTNSSLSSSNNNTPILITVSNLPEAARSIWVAEVCDSVGNCAFYNANRTFIVDLTAPNVTTVNSPITNNVNASTQAILFNVTIKDNVYLVNASVYTNASGLWVRNATNSSLNQLYNNTQILVLVTNLPQNNRSVWNLEACDNAGHCSQYNANQTFIIDLAAPNVTQRNNANPFTSNGATVIFNTTISDNVYLSNASVFFDYAGIWQRQAANTSLSANYNNTPIIVSVSNVPNGNYLWNMEACDAAGNCAFYNANSTFTVTTSSGSTGGVTAPPSSPAPSPKPVDLGTIKYAPPYFVFDAPYGLQKTLELNVQNNKESSVTLSFASLTNLVKVPETIVIPAKSSRTINFKFTAPYQSGTVEDAILVQTDEGAQRRLAVVANIRPYSLKDLGTISFWDNMLKTRIAYLPNAAYVIALLLIAALAIGGDSFASIAARIGFLIIAVVMAYAYYPLIFGA